jgi:hypothetical protein
MASSMGEIMAEGFLEDPKWVEAMNNAGMTEKSFGDFWGKLMNTVMQEVGKSADFIKEINDEDEEKDAVGKAMAAYS